jgi:DNA polymerase-3 subunit delta'
VPAFTQIPGQDDLKRVLQDAIMLGMVPQTLLLTNADGGAGIALALALAQCLACNHGGINPCQKCVACAQFSHFNYPDLVLIFPMVKAGAKKDDAKSCLDYLPDFVTLLKKNTYLTKTEWQDLIESGNKQFTIPVSEAEYIIQQLSVKTITGKPRFIIIWLPENLTPEAANKLLKSLEEPGENNYFFLVSVQSERVLPTILSRCIRYKVPPHRDIEVSDYLISRGLHIDQANALAISSDGKIGQAVASILEDGSFETYAQSFITWMRTLYANHIENAVLWSEQVAKLNRSEQLSFLEFSSKLFEKTLGHYTKHKAPSFEYADFKLAKFAPFIKPESFKTIYALINEAARDIERNGNSKLILSDLCLRLFKHVG